MIRPVGESLSTAEGNARVGIKAGTGFFCAITTGVGVKVVVGCEVAVGAGVSLGGLVGVAVAVSVGGGVAVERGVGVAPGAFAAVSDGEVIVMPGSGVAVLT